MTDEPLHDPSEPGPGAADQPDRSAAEHHPWSGEDRPRGLEAYFAPGGEDDASPERVADERRMVRLLVIMVALLIAIPTLLTLIAFVAQLATLRSGG